MKEFIGDKNFDLNQRAEEKVQVDVDKNEALERDRAADDVFKAIFGDGDDDD